LPDYASKNEKFCIKIYYLREDSPNEGIETGYGWRKEAFSITCCSRSMAINEEPPTFQPGFI